MLHFAQKLRADAQIHVFMGKKIAEFALRQINYLRSELKQGL